MATAKTEFPDQLFFVGDATHDAELLKAGVERARGLAVRVASVGDRSGPRDDDDGGLARSARLQRNERVVDDENPRLVADPLHQGAHHAFVLRPIDAGNAQADRGGDDSSIVERFLHDVMEDLLHRQLPHRLQVGAARARLGDDGAALVSELADGLGPAGVDA